RQEAKQARKNSQLLDAVSGLVRAWRPAKLYKQSVVLCCLRPCFIWTIIINLKIIPAHMNKTALFIALFYLVFSLYLYIAEGIMFIEFIVYIILILAGFSLVQKKRFLQKPSYFWG
ncbi:MAG: hypothetical protein ACOCZ6_05965, partial [Nanoarchaeota archaeon]